MTTLPRLANEWNVGLDALRALVRTDPALRQLGSIIGASRGFSEAEVAVIRAAWAVKQTRRGKPTAGAVARGDGAD